MDSPIFATLTYFWASIKTKSDRHKAFFVRRRGEKAAKDHPDWQAEAGQPRIIAQLKTEIAAVEDYLMKRLGTTAAPGPIMSGVGDKTPRHLDLEDVAAYMVSTSDPVRKNQAQYYRTLRRARSESIVWRAAALHPEVWNATSNAIQEPVLDELFDRRLRSIERMECNVNAGSETTLSPLGRTFTVQSATGTWKDGFRVRMFEYPFVPEKQFASIEPTMTDWTGQGTGELHYHPQLAPPTRVPNKIHDYWVADNSALPNIWIHYRKGALKPAEVVADLFTPNEDFHDRAWFFCDHVGAAVQLEAFWFGKHRRDGNDNTFNATVERIVESSSYVYLGPVLGPTGSPPLNILMDDEPNDPFFDNESLYVEELEVGDELIVWNNRIYDLVSGVGAWRNEFSLVMDIDSSPMPGGAASKIDVAGHGIGTRSVADVATDLTQILKTELANARSAVAKAVAASPTTTSITFLNTKLVRWDPYGEFVSTNGSPRPWWVQVDKTVWHDAWSYATIDDALNSVPRLIGAPSSPPTGFTPPPGPSDSLYFPLFEPVFPDNGFNGDTWRSYLASRATGSPGVVALRELAIDGRLALGIYYIASNTKIPVVRPQSA